ncbi:lactonase family protein [Acetobacteraceae bacterium KSS8]|uniref:Lactonase family protein n=1 Tax=Endosaccharibacter trunci TaxID=2812733 RepID=A0ABT1W2N1_9PROT|nr:lactonase family protein [Acetobacteraceae bacterium KSS8]
MTHRGDRRGSAAMARRAVRPVVAVVTMLLVASSARALATEVEATPPFLSPQRFLVSAAPAGVAGKTASSGGLFLIDMARDGSLQAHSLWRAGSVDRVVASPDGRFLYVAGHPDGGNTGRITALRFENGHAAVLNRLSLDGPAAFGPEISPAGRALLVSNVAGKGGQFGLAVFALGENGQIVRQRQFVPYPSADVAGAEARTGTASFTPDGKAVFLATPGSDTLHAFRFDDRIDTSLKPWTEADLSFPKGSSPGHLVFAPDGRHAYALSVDTPTLFVLRSDGDRLALQQTLSLAEPGRDDGPVDAAPAITPDGRFLYLLATGNRIAVLRLDGDGRASLIGRFPAGARAPVAVAADMIGARLLVADSASGSVVELPVDRNTGAIEPARLPPFPIPAPIAISALR